MGNKLLTILFRRPTVSKQPAHRDISVLWHSLKHQYCDTVHCLAIFNYLLYSLEDLLATCLTIIREQTFMYIRIWKPKGLSTTCFNFKRFKLSPYSSDVP